MLGQHMTRGRTSEGCSLCPFRNSEGSHRYCYLYRKAWASVSVDIFKDMCTHEHTQFLRPIPWLVMYFITSGWEQYPRRQVPFPLRVSSSGCYWVLPVTWSFTVTTPHRWWNHSDEAAGPRLPGKADLLPLPSLSFTPSVHEAAEPPQRRCPSPYNSAAAPGQPQLSSRWHALK